ncbi:MAG TPA: hypothetical protein VI979_01725 [archaeon]|nr:hypothetical protein [archaeon]
MAKNKQTYWQKLGETERKLRLFEKVSINSLKGGKSARDYDASARLVLGNYFNVLSELGEEACRNLLGHRPSVPEIQLLDATGNAMLSNLNSLTQETADGISRILASMLPPDCFLNYNPYSAYDFGPDGSLIYHFDILIGNRLTPQTTGMEQLTTARILQSCLQRQRYIDVGISGRRQMHPSLARSGITESYTEYNIISGKLLPFYVIDTDYQCPFTFYEVAPKLHGPELPFGKSWPLKL